MTSVMLMLLMQLANTQFLVSTKAGLVNYVEGSATVRAATSVPAGMPIATGPGGAVEILLNPGSYLRVGESSQVVLDRIELSDIELRIIQGSAVIEARGVEKNLPIGVACGDLKVEIIKDGVYLFADGKIVVVDGKIRDAGNGLTFGKGYQLSDDYGYRAQKVKTFTTALELWSRKRDELISKANLNVVNSLARTQNLPVSSLLDVWLWYPAFGSFVYMPGFRYRSPYGYHYESVREAYYGGSGSAWSGSGGGLAEASRGGGSSSSGSAGSGGAGAGFGGGAGGAGPAVAPTVQGPARTSTPGGNPRVD